MGKDSGLTAKQAEFLRIYLSNGRNGADAYRRAYTSKASPQNCAVEASKLIRHPKLAPRIAEAETRADQAVERAVERYAVSRERNVAELARMAYANMADYTRRTPEGELVVDFSNADRDALAAVQEVVVEDFVDGRGDDARDVRRVRFKLAAKQGAIERLNRMFGWEIDRQEVKRVDEFSTMSRDELAEYIRTGRKPTREAGETRH